MDNQLTIRNNGDKRERNIQRASEMKKSKGLDEA